MNLISSAQVLKNSNYFTRLNLPNHYGLTLIYLIGALFVLVLAWLPVEFIINRFLFEDFFYYLKIAKNIVLGNKATFDGETLTNGFHPLWMVATIVVQATANSYIAIHLMLTLAALLHLGQVYLIFSILKTETNSKLAHLIAIFYLFNYRIITNNLCGLETPLAGFSLLLVINFLFKNHKLLNSHLVIRLGILTSIAILSRFDLLLLGGAIIILVSLDPIFSGKRHSTKLFNIIIILSTIFIALLPWFLWSNSTLGILLPNSHAALKVWLFKTFSLDLSFSENLSLLIRKIFSTAWHSIATTNLLGLWPVVLPISHRNLPILLLFFSIIYILYGIWKTRTYHNVLPKSIFFALALGLFTYYSLFATPTVRYLMPFSIIIIIIAVIITHELLQQFNITWAYKGAKLIYVVILINSIMVSIQSWQKHQGAAYTHVGHAKLYEAAQWIKFNIPRNSAIGSWNAGIIGYFSERKVVNLDGVVNNEIIRVIKQKDLATYIQEKNILFLADVANQIDSFMNKFSGKKTWKKDYTEIARFGHVVILQKKINKPMVK